MIGRRRPRSSAAGAALAFAALGWAAAASPAAAQQPALPGPPSGMPQPDGEPALVWPEAEASAPTGVAGDHLLYIGTYRNAIYVLDEATEEVVDRIELETGIPRSFQLNARETRFYVVDVSLENVEVVDIASRETVAVHTLSEGNERVRIRGLAVDPEDRYLLLLARSYYELPDRFRVGPMEILRFDLERGEVVGTVPWPDGVERESMNVRFSHDGSRLYFLMDPIRVYDTETFREVDRWHLGEAAGGGLDDFSFSFPDRPHEEPDIYTGIFRATDPVRNQELMGVARVALEDRTVDFTAVGPGEPRFRFVTGPDGGTGYGLQDQVADYQFWTLDLDAGRVESRVRFQGRARMWLQVSSSGDILYIYNAGNTIDLYEADGYRYLRTIVLDTDTTTNLIVLPRPEAADDR